MATHASILAWRIPWTEEPGELWSMESQSRTRLSDLACTQFRVGCGLSRQTSSQRILVEQTVTHFAWVPPPGSRDWGKGSPAHTLHPSTSVCVALRGRNPSLA